MELAKTALEHLNDFQYHYNTRYMSTNVTAFVYICRSHKSCLHRPKIMKKDVGGGQTRYQLMQKENHSHVVVDTKEYGISAARKSVIDSLLLLGMGAGRIRNLFMHKYSNDPELLKRIPKVSMIENRKSRIKKKMQGGWEIDNFITIDSWTHPKPCQSRDVFEQPDPDDFPRMNELIVLERFQNYFTEVDKEIPTLEFILTSRALFGNVKKAVEVQGTSLAMLTDGTYRIHCLGGP
ncbi:unnamed protein product [Phytophthora lilii]|uniref:Unnamed protein product n=1 Tax=Phytophthora lilii TaxID=2077276 RepID=A0A9W6XGD8_9STRA|nr:unnamed protein product [Phytophthora lilii]